MITNFNAAPLNLNIRKYQSLEAGLEDTEAAEIDPYLYPISHPQNTSNFRYILAERDPFATPAWDAYDCRIAFPPSGCLYRPVVPERVALAMHDSAFQLKIEEDRVTVTGHKGYSTARATHYVNRGRWYFEVRVLEMPEFAALRIGWSQHHSNVQAPVGYDKFGYSWRSLKGTRFHAGYGKKYGEGYKAGDVLGFFIELPDCGYGTYLLDSYKDRFLIKYDGHFYYEIKQWPKEVESNLGTLAGSTIEYFKNGYSEGVAFTEIYDGGYYPSISLFGEGKVQVNFGPNFQYPHVLEDYEAQAYYERGQELVVEQYLSNLINLIADSELIPTLRVIDMQ